jgi:GMP synthase (glutamine-hydrolysing)
VHQDDAGAGVLADAARQAGVELIEWLVPAEALPGLDGLAGMVVLGASADIDQEETHPWLTAEKALIRTALARELPLLGVCLGSQLLAEAAGAAVRRLEVSEIGWKTVRVRPESAGDPLFAELEDPAVVFQWHRSTFAVPAQAELLAENDVGPQAFRVGRAWGVQFHPEVTTDIVGGWIDDGGGEPEALAAGVDADSLRRDTEARIAASIQLGQGLFQRFLAVAAST